MMWCITPVQYKVLINGQPQGIIIPNMGLLQDDPIIALSIYTLHRYFDSKYLEEREGEIFNGLKIAQASPMISHLLFADDKFFSHEK